MRPGVHLLAEHEVPAPERWTVASMTGGDGLRDVLTLLGGALGFPDYYGRNMDAAWDCLTDLTEPTMLVWRGWQDFAVNRPDDWGRMVGLLAERCDEQPDFAVVVVR